MCCSARACLLRFTRSEMEKIRKNPAAKETPATVAIDLLNKFTIAVHNSTRNTEANPTGSSWPARVKLGGTFQPRTPLYLKRSTSMARLLNVKLQITPKAYASPSRYTFPRVIRMVKSCRNTTRLTMRYVVPKRGWGCRNQSVRTPSAEMRLRTPLEPMMAVLTAPDNMRKPTTTTKARKNRRSNSGPHRYMASPATRLSL